MHHYPLHRNVEASCTCCRIKRDFTFKSPTDHVICPGCARHQGNSPNQASLRNGDHADLFRSEFLLAQEERKSDAARHHRA